jgi:hypothetical protein
VTDLAARVTGRRQSHLDRRTLGALLAVGVFIGSWAFLGHWFYGRHAKIVDQNHDAVIYQGYGAAMRAGQLPYRDFSVVYPPGALPVFLAPTLVNANRYQTWFARLMDGCGVLCLLFVLAARPPLRAVVFVALFPLLIGSLLLSRFDLWPTALMAGAVAALLRDRYALGFAALGAAFAAKLFAFVLLPIAIVWTLRRSGWRAVWRGFVGWTLVVAAAFVPFVALAPHQLWASLRDQASRAIQIESLAGALLTTFGHPVETYSLGAVSVAGHHTLVLVSTIAEVVVLIALWLGFARGEMEPDRLVRYVAAAVCAFIVLGKVLSPQYLIWLVPLGPLVRGRRGLIATGLLAVSMVATQWYYPDHYNSVMNYHLAWFVLLRDLLLIGLLGVLALPARRFSRSSA